MQHRFDIKGTFVRDSLMRTLVANRDDDQNALNDEFPKSFAAFMEYQQRPEFYNEGFSYRGAKGADPAKDEKFLVAFGA